MILLALLASLASAQSSTTVLSLQDQVKLQNYGKDIRELKSGRPRITGKPVFAGGVCFADGTCMTTAGVGESTVTVSSPLSGTGASANPIALTGAVPTSKLDLSTVTTALATKLATVSHGTTLTGSGTGASPLDTLGISSNCAAGFYLSTITVNAGVITGGGCVAAGSSGGAGHTIASGTVSGNAAGTLAGTLTSRTTLYFDSAGFSAYDDSAGNATIIQAKALGPAALPTRQIFTSGNGTYTTPAGVVQIRIRMLGGGAGGGGAANAANAGGGGGGAGAYCEKVISSPNLSATYSYVTGAAGAGGAAGANSGVAGSSSSWSTSAGVGISTANGGSPGAGSSGSLAVGGIGGTTSGCDFSVSGGPGSANPLVAASNGLGGLGGASALGGGGNGGQNGIYTAGGGAPGSGGGGGGANAGAGAGGSGVAGIIIVDEYYTWQGYAAPASSFTLVPDATTAAGASLGVCQATVTVTGSGAPMLALFNGALQGSANGGTCGWGVLDNGAFATGITATKAATHEVNSAATRNMNLSGPFYLGTPSAGTHSFCFTMNAPNTGTCSVGAVEGGGSDTYPQFGVYEIRNAPGTGDVSSNGTASISGPWTYTKAPSVTDLQQQWQRTSTGNGATGIRCKLFSTTVISSGTAITYTSDATNGDKWTINSDGLYSVSYGGDASGSDNLGVSRGNAACTTSWNGLSASQQLCGFSTSGANISSSCGGSYWLRSGDILHAHQEGATAGTGTRGVYFTVTRIY